jgi:L-alanine-DL-glutamate epimerase-like enolase superfamily enzyme
VTQAPPGAAGASPVLERRRVDLTLRRVWRIARGASVAKTNVLVRLAGGGPAGIGEAAPGARYGESPDTVLRALDRIEPLLDGPPEAIDATLDRIEAALPGDPAARAAVDIALHDRLGRARGAPLHRLFGADPGRMPPTSLSIGIDTPAAMAERAREAAASGFRVLKVKVSGDDARDIIAAVRAATERPLMVDANEAWTDPERAAATLRWMEGRGVLLVEQPLPAADREGARALKRRAAIPLFADEAALAASDLDGLREAYDGVNVKVQKAGGLRAARRMIARARALGLGVMIGCMIETSIGITAAAHLAPLADHVDLDGNLLLAEDPFRGAVVRDGRLVLPETPGLGVEGAW